MMHKRRIILIVIFIILFLFSLTLGSFYHLTSWTESIRLFLKGIVSGEKEAYELLLTSRLPRTISIVLVASGLSVAGLVMQSIARNKFISPSTAGTTDAAILGVLLSHLIFW